MQLTFSFLDGRYGIYRCDPGTDLPLSAERFLSYTRTDDEVSIVAREGAVMCDKKQEGYVVLKLHGPFALSITGVLAEVSKLLALAQVPIFVISTFDTDYILIREEHQKKAITILIAAGHNAAEQAII